MNTLTFGKYTLTADNHSTFDVTKRVTKTRKKKDDPRNGEEYEDEELVGYSMRIKSIITRIAHDQAIESEEVKTLKDYLLFMEQAINKINIDV